MIHVREDDRFIVTLGGADSNHADVGCGEHWFQTSPFCPHLHPLRPRPTPSADLPLAATTTGPLRSCT